MGLFGKKRKFKDAEPCCICGNPKVEEKLADGWICYNCIVKSGGFISGDEKPEDVPKEKVIKCIEDSKKNLELFKQFTPTKKVKEYLYIDETKRQWLLPEKDDRTPIVMSYDDIISVSLQKNGVDVTSGGGAGAMAGGMLFGTTGALVGASMGKKTTREEITNLNIFIITKKPRAGRLFLPLHNGGGVKAGTTSYNYLLLDADRILSEFSIMKADADERKRNINVVSSVSVPDEILKYKNLLDAGVITQEEFEAKKKELLGL